MRRFWALFIMALATAGLSLGSAGSVSAAFNPENKIYVYGVVPDIHSVIVDENGVIIEIDSNTSKDTIPKVFLNSISKENQIDLTADVHQQYLKLVLAGSSKVGVLYKRPPALLTMGGKQDITRKNSILSQLQPTDDGQQKSEAKILLALEPAR